MLSLQDYKSLRVELISLKHYARLTGESLDDLIRVREDAREQIEAFIAANPSDGVAFAHALEYRDAMLDQIEGLA